MSVVEISGFAPTAGQGQPATTGVHRITLPLRRMALGAILVLAAFLNFFALSRNGYANSYYAAAVKSMSLSWHNFFFAAFDPSAFVTIDKPPLGFWFQVASVKLFGFSGTSLLLPQALAGLLSVALLAHLVSRRFGAPAGLLAALCLALTPVAVADNRNNTIDSLLVLFLLLGAWAVSAAVDPQRSSAARLRWLLLSALLVGLGFNIKMLEAFLVVPAFGLVYLLGAPVRWRRRLVHLVLAGVVLLSVSLSWAVAVDLTPASQRPWVDSTTTNSELDLAIGYNGLQRLLGQVGTPAKTTTAVVSTTSTTSTSAKRGTSSVPNVSANTAPSGAATAAKTNSATTDATAGATSAVTSTTSLALSGARAAQGQGNAGGGGGGLFNNGAAGPLRLIDSELGGQAGWLLPLAAIGLLAAGSRRLRFPLDPRQHDLLLWGAWLLTMAGFFSVASFFHSYYLVTLAPAIAALAGIGLVALWHDYRENRSPLKWRGWLLPAALIVTAIAQIHILSGYPSWSRWLDPLVLATAIIPALALAAAKFRGRRLPVWTPLAAAIGSLALLIAPAVWVTTTITSVGSSIPSAGPSVQSSTGGGSGGFGGPGAGGFGGTAGTARFGQPPSGGTAGQPPTSGAGGQIPTGGMTGQAPSGGSNANGDSQLLNYLVKHQGSTKYLVVTTNSNSAASYIISTGKPVMSLGGFGGNDPILTLAQFKALVKNNTVRYVLAGGGGGGGQGTSSAITQWVQSACTVVPSSSYHSTSSGSSSTGVSTGGFGGQVLYDCAGI